MKNIIINGENYQTDSETIDYTSVIGFAGYESDKILSVTYRGKGNGDSQRSGILSPGKFVILEDGLIFNVSDTSNA